MIATRALRKGRFFVCSSKGCSASSAPHPTAPSRHVIGALLCKISDIFSNRKAFTGAYRGHTARLAKLTCRATAQSKTQQKRQDRILFTPLVPDRTLIRVRFSRLCVHRLTPCPAAGFCIRRDSVTASIIGLLF